MTNPLLVFRTTTGLAGPADRRVEPEATRNFSFNAASGSYTYRVTSGYVLPPNDESVTWGTGDAVAAESNARFITYRRFCTNTFGQFRWQLRLLNPGSANDLIRLVYASFGSFDFQYSDRGFATIGVRPIAYGSAATAAALSRAGTSAYAGVVMGRGVRSGGSITAPGEFEIDGTMQVSVDFTGRRFTGTVTLRASRVGTTTLELGSFPISQTGMATLATLSGSAGSGRVEGFLAGPDAEELVGSFLLEVPDPVLIGQTMTIVLAGGARR